MRIISAALTTLLKQVLFLMLLLISAQITGQTTTKTDSIRHARTETELDSLKQSLRIMQESIRELRQAVDSSHSEMNQLISVFDPNETQDENFESRSRRGRVDTLLQAITFSDDMGKTKTM